MRTLNAHCLTHLNFKGEFVKYNERNFSNNEVFLENIVFSLTLILGWKNKEQSPGPTELDLEADNLVFGCLSYAKVTLESQMSVCHDTMIPINHQTISGIS